MTVEPTEVDGVSVDKIYTKAEVEAFIAEIARRVVDSSKANLHSMLAVNHILRLPNAEQLLDEEHKAALRDIWLKLKSTGMQLNDPPLLFGVGNLVSAHHEGEEDGVGLNGEEN